MTPSVRRLAPPLTLAFLALAGAAHAQSAVFDGGGIDPAGSGVFSAAAGWVKGTLMGNVATTLAVIAIGATGLGMLSGRIDWRRGATVILGCFIVFGAATIVAGIKTAAGAPF